MATFTTTINIDQNSLYNLKAMDYSLYGFKSVAATGNGAPTIWFSLPSVKLLGKTVITWEEEFEAYDSITSIVPNVTIQAENTVATGLRELVTIEKGSGNIASTTNGLDGTISFFNNDTQEFTVGINQLVNGQSNILCAFPILGSGNSSVITPINKIALIFATQRIPNATVMTKAMAAGAFIDLTDATSHEVNYDINTGWSAGGALWLKNFGASTDLTSLLIEDPNN